MADSEHVESTRDVYDHSATLYAEVVGTSVSPQFESALDRGVLDAFIDDALAARLSTALDIGCGPGRATAYLAARGLEARGIDLSPQMVAAARTAHPHLRFDEGLLSKLPTADASADCAVLWYSIIHTPPNELPAVWTELGRVLRARGPVLIGFQAGENDRFEREDAYGSGKTLTSYRHSISDVAASLEQHGFEVQARVSRRATLPHESTPQAIVIARLTN